jgi:hypothetical protein
LNRRGKPCEGFQLCGKRVRAGHDRIDPDPAAPLEPRLQLAGVYVEGPALRVEAPIVLDPWHHGADAGDSRRAAISPTCQRSCTMSRSTTRRQFIAAAAAVAGSAALPSLAVAQGKADASIEFTLWRAGFIVGGSGGTGVMTVGDKGYHLSIGGISLGATIGVARAEFLGEVYNLKQPSDVEGTYTAVSAGGALAGGGGVAELQNSRGVRLRVQGRQIGVMVSIDLSGMQISIRN